MKMKKNLQHYFEISYGEGCLQTWLGMYPCSLRRVMSMHIKQSKGYRIQWYTCQLYLTTLIVRNSMPSEIETSDLAGTVLSFVPINKFQLVTLSVLEI